MLLTLLLCFLLQTTLGQVQTRGNVLVIDIMGGSSQSRNLIEMANGLAIDGFNVTVLAAQDAKLPDTQNLHLHKIPLPSEEIFPSNAEAAAKENGYSRVAFYVLDKAKSLTELLMKEKAEVIEALRDTKFEAAITGILELDTMIASALNLTSIRYLSYLPEPMSSVLADFPSKLSVFHSSIIPIPSIVRGFSIGSIPYRLFGVLNYLLMSNILPNTDTLIEYAHQNYEDVKTKAGKSFILTSGVEGALMDAAQRPPNVASVYPLAIQTSKNQIDMTLNEEYQRFLEKFEKVVIIAFGTTFRPSEASQLAIAEMIKKTQNVGFIWALKESGTKYDQIRAMNLPNLLLKNFIPQKELMNHPRTKAFVSHGGANSVLESLYYGLPVFGMPLDADQYSNIAKLEKEKAGFYISNYENMDELRAKLLEVLNDENHELIKGVNRFKRMFEFYEERSSKNLTYWIDHQQRFGTEHFRSKYNKVSLTALYDLDIVAMLAGPPLGLILLVVLGYSLTGRKKSQKKAKGD